MPSSIQFERPISPAELDHYLARGYRVAGQAIYTSEYIKLGQDRLVSVLPLRLGLDRHTFGKNLRKCKRKNDRKFRAVIGPAGTEMEAEYALNRRYMELKPEKGIEDFSYHVLGQRLMSKLIPTWQVRVYDGDRLVATSYFDLGEEGAYSKQGIYDPDYEGYSLGFYTMLLEIDFCKWSGRKWYYPGYIGVETTEFDYKLRLGAMQYFDFREQRWRPFERTAIKLAPLAKMRKELEVLKEILTAQGVESEVLRYLYGDVRYSTRMEPGQYLDGPFILLLSNQSRSYKELVVTYELVGKYPFGLVEPERSFSALRHPKFFAATDTYDYISKAKRNLHYSPSAERMAMFILNLLQEETEAVL